MGDKLEAEIIVTIGGGRGGGYGERNYTSKKVVNCVIEFVLL